MNERYYQQLHASCGTYSAAGYDIEALLRHPVMSDWILARHARVRILDVGVGKGVFLFDLIAGLKLRYLVTDQACGMDVVRSPGAVFESLDVRGKFTFILGDASKEIPVTTGFFDIVTCNHVLEHVFETEKLLRELHRCLEATGLCIVSVPNCAYWPSRIMGLWGCQPLGGEIGTEHTKYGLRPKFLQKRLEECRPSGHVRAFTPAGLQDICEHCGFEVVGWWKQSYGLLARLSPWAARNMAVILKKR